MRTNVIPSFSVLLMVTSSGWAAAQTPVSVPELTFVTGSSSCPDTESVARESIRLTPVDQRDIVLGARVVVDDLGDRYRVSVFAPGLLASKTYVDRSRDCARRTTVAAVLVFTTLLPPQFAEGTPEPEEVERPAEARDAVPNQEPRPPANPGPVVPRETTQPNVSTATKNENVRSHPSRVRLALGVAGVVAPSVASSISTQAWGISLRTAVGSGSVAPFLDVSYAIRSNFELLGIAGDFQYSSAAGGFEWGQRLGAIDLSLSAGAVVALERVRGRDLLLVKSQSVPEFGARLGLSAAWHADFVAPFVAVSCDTFPGASEIAIAPRGRLGTTPKFEFWNMLGVRVSL